MKTLPWKLAGLIVVIACTSASAYVVQYPLGGTTSLTRCSIRGKSASAIRGNIIFGDNLAGDALTTADSQLFIFNGAGGTGCVAYTLPVTGWKRVGGNDLYRDPQGKISPVTRVAEPGDLPRITVRSSAAQPFNYPLSAAPQGSVSVLLITPDIIHACSASLFDACTTDADCGGAPGSCQPLFVENCGTFINPTKDNTRAFMSNTLAPITSCPTPPPGCSPGE